MKNLDRTQLIIVALLLGFLLLSLTACMGPRGKTGKPGQSVIGPAGPQGVPGADGLVEIIDPCGDQSDHDEVILRFSNGVLIAYFADGGSATKARLIVLEPGEYVVTDGTDCKFTVTPTGEVISD